MTNVEFISIYDCPNLTTEEKELILNILNFKYNQVACYKNNKLGLHIYDSVRSVFKNVEISDLLEKYYDCIQANPGTIKPLIKIGNFTYEYELSNPSYSNVHSITFYFDITLTRVISDVQQPKYMDITILPFIYNTGLVKLPISKIYVYEVGILGSHRFSIGMNEELNIDIMTYQELINACIYTIDSKLSKHTYQNNNYIFNIINENQIKYNKEDNPFIFKMKSKGDMEGVIHGECTFTSMPFCSGKFTDEQSSKIIDFINSHNMRVKIDGSTLYLLKSFGYSQGCEPLLNYVSVTNSSNIDDLCFIFIKDREYTCRVKNIDCYKVNSGIMIEISNIQEYNNKVSSEGNNLVTFDK